MWWWSMDWPAPWMSIPVIVILALALCIAVAFMIACRGFAHLSMACCGLGFRPGKQHGDDMREGALRRESTGRAVFDAYRADTLRRLEREQIEFASFLDHLRGARDKAEFDQFMAERGRPDPVSGSQPRA